MFLERSYESYYVLSWDILQWHECVETDSHCVHRLTCFAMCLCCDICSGLPFGKLQIDRDWFDVQHVDLCSS